ncbi:hypothetical protein WMF04_45595 [Sorangium sp. So ce260]|uniref:hypothetical protein n=1 Tax=Sorangium sp. So ce260 TaxID=3133291 RepID=UPI003F62B48D
MDERQRTPTVGSMWRVLAYRGAERVEVEGEGVFDELVVDDWIHLEQMDDDVWWLRIGDARVTITVALGQQPTVDVCRSFYAPQKGTSSVHE